MNALLAHLGISVRLHFRNKMALLYGYLFPLIFLVAFWVLYRHDRVPLIRHLGELLTVSVLGGACFGLPTTLVSERERGVWRRFRLTPVPTWALVTSTAIARYLIILSAGLLQLAAALALGMPFPEHPLALWLVFTFVSFAFIGLGLVIAALADNVPAVQALGQCIFLPMLIIGGVAVPLISLPLWAQHVSAFFPGRYAVEALQACTNGDGLLATRFGLFALTLIGFAGCLAGAKLFRWDAQQRFAARTGKIWLVPALAAWLIVGLTAETRGRIAVAKPADESAQPAPTPVAVVPTPSSAAIPAATTSVAPQPTLTPPPTAPAAVPAAKAEPAWMKVTAKDTNALDFNLPPDEGIVAPFASPDEEIPDFAAEQVAIVRRTLPAWAPGNDRDELQAIRNLLCVAAVPDAIQLPVERYLPPVVLERMEEVYAKDKLVKALTWIAMHPEEGLMIGSIDEVGVEGEAGDLQQVRERVYLYALKFLVRVTDRKPN